MDDHGRHTQRVTPTRSTDPEGSAGYAIFQLHAMPVLSCMYGANDRVSGWDIDSPNNWQSVYNCYAFGSSGDLYLERLGIGLYTFEPNGSVDSLVEGVDVASYLNLIPYISWIEQFKSTLHGPETCIRSTNYATDKLQSSHPRLVHTLTVVDNRCTCTYKGVGYMDRDIRWGQVAGGVRVVENEPGIRGPRHRAHTAAPRNDLCTGLPDEHKKIIDKFYGVVATGSVGGDVSSTPGSSHFGSKSTFMCSKAPRIRITAGVVGGSHLLNCNATARATQARIISSGLVPFNSYGYAGAAAPPILESPRSNRLLSTHYSTYSPSWDVLGPPWNSRFGPWDRPLGPEMRQDDSEQAFGLSGPQNEHLGIPKRHRAASQTAQSSLPKRHKEATHIGPATADTKSRPSMWLGLDLAVSWYCERKARYGLRGVRIGEAANPGPAADKLHTSFHSGCTPPRKKGRMLNSKWKHCEMFQHAWNDIHIDTLFVPAAMLPEENERDMIFSADDVDTFMEACQRGDVIWVHGSASPCLKAAIKGRKISQCHVSDVIRSDSGIVANSTQSLSAPLGSLNSELFCRAIRSLKVLERRGGVAG